MKEFDELVNEYQYTKHKIRRLALAQQELRELGGLPQNSNDGMPHATGFCSPVENYLIRLGDLEEEQKRLEKVLESLRNEILCIIDRIPNYTTREILEYRVFMEKGWRYIARKLNYSESRIRQLYDEGISIIA